MSSQKNMNTSFQTIILLALLATLPLCVKGQSAKKLLDRSVTRQKARNWEGAIADLNRVIKLSPDDPVAYYYRGIAKYNKGDLEGAILDYTHALKFDSDDASIYHNRGVAKNDMGDLDGAIDDFSHSIELDPKDLAAYLGRSLVMREKGDFESAIADLTRVLEINPRYSLAFAVRGLVKRNKDDLDGAMADLNHALELDPESEEARISRASVHFIMQNWSAALSDLRSDFILSPQRQCYHQAMIWLILARTGEKEAADKELAKFLENRQELVTDDWPLKITGHLLDRVSETDLFDSAKSAEDNVESGRLCEAWFYSGMKKLIAGENQTAATCFKKCLATGRKSFLEHDLADAELKALAP